MIRTMLQAQGRNSGMLEAASGCTTVSAGDLRILPARSVGNVRSLRQLWHSLELDGLQCACSRSCSGLEMLALLRAIDVLDDHAPAIAERLALSMRPHIDQDLAMVIYDLTTVRVHGEAVVPDDVRAYGASKDGDVAREFVLSLVQTADGLPIAHEVHPGNTAEAPTLMPMIRSLLARWPLKRVVLVADRGLLSLNNLREIDALQAELDAASHGVRLEYVLAVPAARYGEFKEELLALDAAGERSKPWTAEMTWRRPKAPAAATPGPQNSPPADDEYRLVVAHDPEAAARRTQARQDQIKELVTLGEQWGGRPNEQEAGERRRGRPLSDSCAKARLYHAVKDANLAHLIKVDLKSELFQFTLDEARQQYPELLGGKLLLVRNTDAPLVEEVQRYKSLADIERGFRALKSEIEIGPVYHRLPKRIRAHALVCFLALVLHRVMRMRLKAQQRNESSQRLLELLRRTQHQSAKAANGQVVRGLTEMGVTKRQLFETIWARPTTPAVVRLSDAQMATEAAV